MPKRKSVPKPVPDPRYVLGQLCYLDGAGYARCRVCQSGDQITPTGRTYIPHASECVIGQAVAAIKAALDEYDLVPVQQRLQQAVTLLWG